MTLQEIADQIGGKLNGPANLEISGPAKIEEAGSTEITFLSNQKYRKFINETKAAAVLIDKEIDDIKIPYILVENAYVAFVFTLNLFNTDNTAEFSGISSRADIDETAKIGANVSIAPNVYIGPDVTVKDNTVIHPGVVIYNGASVGEDCLIYSNVSIRENCTIGDRVILQNGAVIGSDGFGFAPVGGKYKKIPQLGNVIIEDDVEIGANSTIDRATLGSTVIKNGTKLDNLVQLGHNVIVGENTVIVSQTGIAGSTKIGNHVTISGQVGIAGHIKIGDNVVIAAQSGISKDVAEGSILFGSPALPIMKQKRIDVSMRHLPEMAKRLHSLENEIIELKEKLNKE
jgi:UDP-3-O-[3-hydroxymyristoyl] glucosamine N-acyltransferase